MSDAPVSPPTETPPAVSAAPPPAAAAASAAPISPEFLPPNMRKHVDLAAPVSIRMMGAKALVPVSPSDMLGLLFMLTFDPDTGVRETAQKSAASLPDRILASAVRDEGIQAPVLGFFLELFREKEQYAEPLILNATTPDTAVASVASTVSLRLAEIIGQNQLRVLRHDDLIRQLCLNPNATGSLLDSVCDFAVRSGVRLLDVPQMQAARVRIFGPEAIAKPPDVGPTAEEVMEEYEGLSDESSTPLEEGQRLNLTQRVMKMSVSEKIKLATLGNKEARTILLRDTNKLVATAVMRSPRMTDNEVLGVAQNRAVMDDVLRIVYNNREWTKQYVIKMALVKNPKTPLSITMRFLNTLRESDVKGLSRDKNVSSTVQGAAKKMMDAKDARKK